MWFNHRCVTSACLIDLQQTLAAFKRKFSRVYAAWLDIQHIKKALILQDIITFDIDPVDDGVFKNGDIQNATIKKHVDILEKLSFEQPLQGDAQRALRYAVTNPDRQIGQDGRRRHPAVAIDDDFLDFNKLVT